MSPRWLWEARFAGDCRGLPVLVLAFTRNLKVRAALWFTARRAKEAIQWKESSTECNAAVGQRRRHNPWRIYECQHFAFGSRIRVAPGEIKIFWGTGVRSQDGRPLSIGPSAPLPTVTYERVVAVRS